MVSGDYMLNHKINVRNGISWHDAKILKLILNVNECIIRDIEVASCLAYRSLGVVLYCKWGS